MKRFSILFLISALLFTFSCTHKAEKKTFKEPKVKGSENRMYTGLKNSGGNAGEIEIVIDKKLWDSPLGDTIFYFFAQPFPALPQDEPFFKMLQIEPNAFNSIYKEHRNILFVKIGPSYKRGWIIEHNRWAYNQIVVTYQAPDKAQFMELFRKTRQRLLDTLYMEELHRYQAAFYNFRNPEVIDRLEEKFHIYLLIPNSYSLDVDKNNFAWIARETATSSQGILIYTRPYNSRDNFTVQSITNFRDTVTKYNVPGPKEGSYMQIERLYPVQSQVLSIDGHYAMLIRGLWKTHGAFLGGPFINLSVLDEKRGRIVAVDGFVYAGKLDKKLYLWQVEAIIRTLKIID